MVINVKQNQWQQEIKFENKEEIGSQETKGKYHAQKIYGCNTAVIINRVKKRHLSLYWNELMHNGKSGWHINTSC